MCNKSNLGDECYVCNISSYTDRILETSTYLTGGISLPKVFPTLESQWHCPTKTQESYVATKNSRENKRNWFQQDPQVGLAGPTNFTVQQLFHKNGSHGTIHTFKNYFATVFSVFSFQLYPNGLFIAFPCYARVSD